MELLIASSITSSAGSSSLIMSPRATRANAPVTRSQTKISLEDDVCVLSKEIEVCDTSLPPLGIG